MSQLILQKHEREFLKMVEDEGCEVLEIIGGSAHKKLRFRLPNGDVVLSPMASSPKNKEHMLKAGRRQIRRALAGMKWGKPT